MLRVLLAEPGYPTKYPPLGLMKISTFHKIQGDYVEFVKGNVEAVRARGWDRIYVSSLFTFHWKRTVETILFYRESVPHPSDVWVGGVMATLMPEQLARATGATVVEGLLNKPHQLDSRSGLIVDELTPDYSLLAPLEPPYKLADAFVGYATRGCPNRCRFCAVGQIEPVYRDYLPLKRQVQCVRAVFGEKQDLILLDNSVLASRSFARIISDIRDLGFEKGARHNKRLRRVDFNQGVDARLLTPEAARELPTIAMDPLRLALDDSRNIEPYTRAIEAAAGAGVVNLATYVLYNFEDDPADLYRRLRTSVMLNQRLGTHIYSFPMRYVPLNAFDRRYVGPRWMKRFIRGLQCILVVTRGMVGPHLDFFEAAFGQNEDELMRILLMPEQYIVNRRAHEFNGARAWSAAYDSLTKPQHQRLLDLIGHGRVSPEDVARERSPRLKAVLDHYLEHDKA